MNFLVAVVFFWGGGLVIMNCSNSIAIDLMSSVCMAAVGFPFFGPPLTRNPPIVWFPAAQRSAPSSSTPRQRRPREKTKWSEPEILVCLCWLLLHPPFHCLASRTSRPSDDPLPCVRCDEAEPSVSPPEMFHCNSLKRRSRQQLKLN